jgi:hypothetical protein
LTELDETAEKELRITQGDAHLFPAELITSHIFAALLVAHTHHPPLLLVEEVCLSRVVGQTKPDENSAQGTEKAFNDVDPSNGR